MKSVYTWRLIYILILFLPSQLRAQPNSSLSLLESYLGAPVLKASISVQQNIPLRIGELVSYLDRYALVTKEAPLSPGYFYIITSLNPLKPDFLYFDEVAHLRPRMILKDLTLVERLSNI